MAIVEPIKPTTPGRDNIAKALLKLVRPIDSLTLDESNARKHGDRSIEEIENSLRRFGQLKPVVADARGVVRAGNGTVVAARKLGWTKLAVVKSDLPAAELRAFAVADNRTAELSEWDDVTLADLLRDAEIGDVGFTPEEIAELTGDEQTQLEYVDTQPPPKMAWVLIGVPVVRFGEIADAVQQVSAIEGVICEVTANDSAPAPTKP